MCDLCGLLVGTELGLRRHRTQFHGALQHPDVEPNGDDCCITGSEPADPASDLGASTMAKKRKYEDISPPSTMPTATELLNRMLSAAMSSSQRSGSGVSTSTTFTTAPLVASGSGSTSVVPTTQVSSGMTTPASTSTMKSGETRRDASRAVSRDTYEVLVSIIIEHEDLEAVADAILRRFGSEDFSGLAGHAASVVSILQTFARALCVRVVLASATADASELCGVRRIIDALLRLPSNIAEWTDLLRAADRRRRQA